MCEQTPDTTHSKARLFLSRLMEDFGSDGLLVVRKPSPGAPEATGADGADLVPGAALRWPKCECGHSLCPDSEQSPER
ncbi:hypothetical protein ACIRQP_20110 [Streptomyces sp. NPDC102274]|uniref:hypothetical protein n=1 Tax=Streptomyces sp. NPDC102274 TaxID=3366151 RepID=UPI0038158F08